MIDIPYALYITNMTNQIYFVYMLRIKKKFPTLRNEKETVPIFPQG